MGQQKQQQQLNDYVSQPDKPASQTASQPASQPASKPTSQQASLKSTVGG
jgi:hypothetical protein